MKQPNKSEEAQRQLSTANAEPQQTTWSIKSTGKIPNAAEIAQWRERYDGAAAARLLANLLSEHAVKTALSQQIITTPDGKQMASSTISEGV